MYEQVMENLRKATESSIQMQQEMMRKWTSLMPGMGGESGVGAGVGPGPSAFSPGAAGNPVFPGSLEAFTKFQRAWEDAMSDVMQRQRQLVDSHYNAGLQAIHDMFRVGEARSPQEYQEKVLDLYRKSFESLRALSESQLRELKAAAEKWIQFAPKSNAS